MKYCLPMKCVIACVIYAVSSTGFRLIAHARRKERPYSEAMEQL